MDRNLDIDNFELLLRERSDEFKMYPTKRIWHSIYNNIHPGRKWPSIAMSITLIAILLLIGYLNTNNQNLKQEAFSEMNFAGNNLTTDNSFAFNIPFLEYNSQDKYSQKSFTKFADNFTSNISSISADYKKISGFNLADNLIYSNNTSQAKALPAIAAKTVIENNPNLISNMPVLDGNTGVHSIIKNELLLSLKNTIADVSVKNVAVENITPSLQQKTIAQISTYKNQSLASPDFDGTTPAILSVAADVAENKDITTDNKNTALGKGNISLTNEEREWIENYALYNRAAPKKWAGKLASQMYITPSVVFRELKNTISTEAGINSAVIQHPSFGIEIGGGILYEIFKGVKVKTGLQLNFTRYNTRGYGNSHPVATTITLRSSTGQLYPSYRSTPYSNNDGIAPLKLHNETFQISIPVGVDVKLAGNDKLQWNIGATIQPSYVFAGKSYLISSDKRNYIKESSLLNRLNLNAGFETFISYKTNNGFTFQLGPQFRKQLFTTNNKQYVIEERLNNYGIKFGITKLIK